MSEPLRFKPVNPAHEMVYSADGGWVGLTYSYQLSDGFVISGSQTPRRV